MRLEDAIKEVDGNYGPSPYQLLDIIFRCVLHFAAILACVVPVQLFRRSGELAGATLVVSGALMNLYHFTNALLWHGDDIANWPRGYGWCDIQVATAVPVETLVAASTCAILRNVANQISLLRATALSGNEKRRKNLTHALIIFPIPLLQVILFFFVTGMRYNISAIIGCQAVFTTNWVFLLFFLLPCPILSVCAGYYAVITWWKYRQIDNESRVDLWNSRTSGAQARNARARRRLYFMTLTIVAPWAPMQLVFLYNNAMMGMPWNAPFKLSEVHRQGWDQIDYSPTWGVPWSHMYGAYAYPLEVLIVFLYFGLTKDAHDLYRGYLRALGLGRIFPRLYDEYIPSDQPPSSFSSVWSRVKRASTFGYSPQGSQGSPGGSRNETIVSTRQFSEVDDIRPLNIRLDSLDLEAARSTTEAARSTGQVPQLPTRNPWIFRTSLAPHFNMGAIFKGKKGGPTRKPSSQDSLKPVIHPLHTTQSPSAMGKYHAKQSPNGTHDAAWNRAPTDGRVHTRVWAADREGASAVDDSILEEKEMGDGVVKVDRYISSSTEASPPKPAYR